MSQALWHLSPKESVLKSAEMPQNSANVVIHSICSLISLGTERTIATGCCDASFETNMKVPFMEGSFDFPLKYGYSLVGHLVGNNDQLVHLMHPHQSRCWVAETDFTLVPKGVSAARASLISNMETVINAVWDARPEPGDRILIIGFGALGSLLALFLKDFPGIQVQISEIHPWKRSKALEMGFELQGERQTYDKIFHLSGTRAGLQSALELCKQEGSVVEMSWYGNKRLELSLGTSFHYGRKSLISSQVSQIPIRKQPEWDYKKRKALVMELLKNEKYDQVLTHRIPFEDTPQFFQHIRSGNLDPGLNYLISYLS